MFTIDLLVQLITLHLKSKVGTFQLVRFILQILNYLNTVRAVVATDREYKLNR